MEIYFNFIFLFYLFCKSFQKTLEEKMKSCILYLSNETNTYEEALQVINNLEKIYKNNDKIRIEELFKVYRKLNSERNPGNIPQSYIEDESFLSDLNFQKGLVEINDLKPVSHIINNDKKIDSTLFRNIYIWKGDITRLKVNAIVNAANNKLFNLEMK